MDPTRPPDTFEDLCLWKVFVMTYDGDLWQIINRWIKKYGNPFAEIEVNNYAAEHDRRIYQEALRYCYVRNKPQ